MSKARPKVDGWNYLLGTCFAIGLLWAWYIVENVFERDIKRWHKLDRNTSRLTIWIPIASVPLTSGVFYFLYRRKKEIEERGVTVNGRVIWIGYFSNNGMRSITFAYDFEGREHEKSQAVRNEFALSLKEGNPIELLVVPGKPSHAMALTEDE